MTDMFLEKFRALVPKYLEDEWQEEDGLTPDELDDALSDHSFTIPLVLREFYLAIGGCEDLMEAYHYFWDPRNSRWTTKASSCSLRTRTNSSPGASAPPTSASRTPIVWRRNNARGQWKSEEGTFSEFVFDMFEWAFNDDED